MSKQAKYKSYREQLRECGKNHTAEVLSFGRRVGGIIWCHKYGVQCKSSVCKEERMKNDQTGIWKSD